MVLPQEGFVLDCSLALSWYLPDEHSSVSDTVFKIMGKSDGWVPALWWLEFSNAMVMAVRRKRIDSTHVSKSMNHVIRLPLRTDPDMPPFLRLVEMAQQLNLSVYDTSYLELAQRKQVPLATLDKALARAAKLLGLPTLGLVA